MDRFAYYLSEILKGLPVTLSLSFTAIISACFFAVILAVLLTSKKRFVTGAIKTYILLFTGTPLLVQIFLIYYGPGQFDYIREEMPQLWSIISQPWFCVYLALTLNSAAYTTQIFYGALKAVPVGQWQACAVLGMSKVQSLKVIVPFALKRAMSSYSNEIIFVVKGTALASAIPLMDLMKANQFIYGRYNDFSIYAITGVIYLLINGILSIIMRKLEKRALAFETPNA